MTFSERMGFKPSRSVFQREEMDEPLRVSLWNCFHVFFYEPVFTKEGYIRTPEYDAYNLMVGRLWVLLFKHSGGAGRHPPHRFS